MPRLSGTELANKSHAQNSVRHRRPRRTSQIGLMQDVLLNGILAGTIESAVCSAVNAWCTSESLRRDILLRGKPKPVEPVNASKAKTRRPIAPIEPA